MARGRPKKQVRDYQIDILKALGIICVVAGHTGSSFTNWFYAFHMALFFFVSGYLRYGKKDKSSWKDFIKKRAKTSIIPYVVFWFISVLYAYGYGFALYKELPKPIELEAYKGLLLGGETLYLNTNNFPIWYLQFYFIGSIVFEFIIRYFNKYFKVITFIILLIVTIPIQKAIPGRPIFHIDVLPSALIYMLFGYYFKHLLDNKKLEEVKSNIPIGIFILVFGWGISMRYGGSIADVGGYSYLVGAALIIVGLYILSVKLINSKKLLYIGEKTLYILGLHCLTRDICSSFTRFIFECIGLKQPFLENVVVVILTIILCCAAAELYKIIKKYVIEYYNLLKNKKLKKS